jgi:hypothetical protein
MTLNKFICGLALTTLFAMGLFVMGLSAVGSAVVPAHADSIHYTFTDGSGHVISFALPQFPTPAAIGPDYFAVSTTVTIDGAPKTEDITFYAAPSYSGGLSIASTPVTDQVINQRGAQLYSGTTSTPRLLTESDVTLRCTNDSTGVCEGDAYSQDFTLRAAAVGTGGH